MSMRRTFHHLQKDISGPLEAVVWPSGMSEAQFNPERDLSAVHQLLADSYSEAGNPFSDLESWSEWLTSDLEYSPDAIFLARGETGGLIGVCHCWTTGFIKDLAVTPAYRRKGIGKALLLRSFIHFAGKGTKTMQRKVEIANKTGAEALYRQLGMVEC